MQLVQLVFATAASLDAELAGDHQTLAGETGAAVSEWPPVGGLWDTEAMSFFRSQIDEPSFVAPWVPMYIVNDTRLVGSAGFFGPPEDGEVEVGYSVCLSERQRGIATAAVTALCALAREHACRSVRARTTADNTASLQTLFRNGFVEVSREPNEEGTVEVLLRLQL